MRLFSHRSRPVDLGRTPQEAETHETLPRPEPGRA